MCVHGVDIDIICGNVPVVGMVKYSPFDEHASEDLCARASADDEAAELPASALLGTSHPNPSPNPNPNPNLRLGPNPHPNATLKWRLGVVQRLPCRWD